MLTVVLTRHGATPRSDTEQHLGKGIDIGLSPQGEAAAGALGRRLAGVPFEQVVSSPLLRARQTAAAVAPQHRIEIDERLREMDYGAWEGLTYEQIEARDPEYRRRWEADPAALACPGGESGDDVAARVRSFLADVIGSSSADASILVIAHSTLNRVFLCVALGVPLREYRRRFVQSHANLTVLQFPGPVVDGALLLTCNDVSHLRSLPRPLNGSATGAPTGPAG